ncbi:hypothetical protein, partial [Aeromonas hydrophila]
HLRESQGEDAGQVVRLTERRMPSLAGAAGTYPGWWVNRRRCSQGDASARKSPARQSSIHYLAGSLYK